MFQTCTTVNYGPSSCFCLSPPDPWLFKKLRKLRQSTWKNSPSQRTTDSETHSIFWKFARALCHWPIYLVVLPLNCGPKICISIRQLQGTINVSNSRISPSRSICWHPERRSRYPLRFQSTTVLAIVRSRRYAWYTCLISTAVRKLCGVTALAFHSLDTLLFTELRTSHRREKWNEMPLKHFRCGVSIQKMRITYSTSSIYINQTALSKNYPWDRLATRPKTSSRRCNTFRTMDWAPSSSSCWRASISAGF